MTAALVAKSMVLGKSYRIWHGVDVPEGQLNLHTNILNIFMLIATATLLLEICHRQCVDLYSYTL